MTWPFNTRYPSIEDLRQRARGRIPGFAFEYLDGGCNEDVNVFRNTAELRKVELVPQYITDHVSSDLKTELFGHLYDAPFGVAPVGLQGLMWPNATEILASAAFRNNIPFVLSTVTTSSIERISELTEGRAWFQLYHPAENSLRDDLIKRLEAANYPVLVLLCDVPSFGYRPRDIRNGLAMPPRMTVKNIWQIMGRPAWAIQTLIHGQPEFSTLKPYMPGEMNMKQLGQFMNRTFSGKLSKEKIAAIRDRWKGKIVLKGVVSEEDTAMALTLGLDGIIVSNHGGRQLDAGQSAIKAIQPIVKNYKGRLKIMMDSGIRSGPDVARAMAHGAEFTFMGRTFMYGISALGSEGGDHTTNILKTQLHQVMDQLCCATTGDFYKHLPKQSTGD
ncbi:alpha-hydroxy acid oxidase [Chryseolinea lacunae]|uniref:Alpha-hydroxy-acid oxidizing protein n=1 Tax=Chryseolinea lacunae TaxID=2801331 RepID=A0ABS1L249_9BACT|nr:alpha-hydroxy acid oxidase [Chryseolinea lacunae]MBL0745765.1 alpha-hydroxy-acid oxidizing protein [Chryseolinea lacunae]